jgi:hypothetical protein
VQRPDQRDGSCQGLHLFSMPSPQATHSRPRG